MVAAIQAANRRDVVRALFEETPARARTHAPSSTVRSTAIPRCCLRSESSLPDHKKDERIAILREPWPDGHRPGQRVLPPGPSGSHRSKPRVTAILERDYESRAADRATLAPVDLIERTTSGIRWLPEAGVKRVILAPSYFSRPYNFLMSASDLRLFGYPVADEALEEIDPLAAAASPSSGSTGPSATRRGCKILKLLAGRDLYLTEIAQQLELSKPTIKHHLALLRSAGLVTITESGTVVYYTLRRNRLDDASADIKRFLIG